MRTTFVSAARSTTRSAKLPHWVKPGCCWSGHTCAFPPRLHSHAPHPMTNGTVTRSPTLHRCTPSPTSTMSRPARDPERGGGRRRRDRPRRASRSCRVRSRAPRPRPRPAGAVGASTSRTSSGSARASMIIARMASILHSARSRSRRAALAPDRARPRASPCRASTKPGRRGKPSGVSDIQSRPAARQRHAHAPGAPAPRPADYSASTTRDASPHTRRASGRAGAPSRHPRCRGRARTPPARVRRRGGRA